MDGNVGYIEESVSKFIEAIHTSETVVTDGVTKAVEKLNEKIATEWNGPDQVAFAKLALEIAAKLNVELKKVFDGLAADAKNAETYLINRQSDLASHYAGGSGAGGSASISGNTNMVS